MAQDPLIGTTVGNYEIVERIAQGGMATVYRGRQTTIGREGRRVAIKVIDAEYAKDPTLSERFRREVEMTADLQHPHILPVYDYGQIDNRPYIVMAYMPGGSVHDLIVAPGEIPFQRIQRIIDQTSAALDYAHRSGVIHRDLKPSNILLDNDGNAHLADFGIAKVLREESQQLTGDKIIGTLSYMAPEMFKREAVTPAVDIYALGVTLYQMLTGETPYKGDTAQVIGAHLHEPIPDPRRLRPDLPDGVGDIVKMAMAKYPEDRYPSANALAEDLRAAFAGTKPTAASPDTAPHPKAPRPVPPSKPQAQGDINTIVDEYMPQGGSPPANLPPVPPPPEYNYMPLPQNPPASWGGYAEPARKRGGIPIPLLIGVLAMLLILILACGVAGFLYFGAPTAADVDSPVGEGDASPVVLPTNPPTERPEPTDTPKPGEPTPVVSATEPVEDLEAIEDSILAYDEQMRYLLETGDTSTIGDVARGNARDDRIAAIGKLKAGCLWDYDHRGLDFLDFQALSQTRAKVTVNVDRGGEIVCESGEEWPQYAFTGPYTAIYVAEYVDDRWWVTEYCSLSDTECVEGIDD
jgi:serine/threonine protein kinase